MLDGKTFIVAFILGIFGGLFIQRNFTVQFGRFPTDQQWLYVKNELDTAHEMGKPHVKFYFNPYKTTLQALADRNLNYTFHPQDDECIDSLAQVKEGSSEYYAILSRDGCNRRWDFHWRVNMQKSE